MSKQPALQTYLGVFALIIIMVAGILWLLSPWFPSLLWWLVIAVLGVSFSYVAGMVLLLSLLGRLSLTPKAALLIRLQVLWLYGFVEILFKGSNNLMKLQHALIELNNRLIDACHFKVPFERILVLTPHCVQLSKCGLKVTGEENHCSQCGACNVGTLKSIQKAYGVQVAIATGGTLARKVIKDKKPKLIIAVACERDLVSGLRDASPLPVFAIQNQRPFGPCVDTTFDAVKLECVIRDKGK